MKTTIKGALTFYKAARSETFIVSFTPLTGDVQDVSFDRNALASHVIEELIRKIVPAVEAPVTRAPADPWIAEVYRITNEYHNRTGNKCAIGDILEAFFAMTVHDVDPGDRDAFMVQLKQRLA